jgi:hypothetical protein
MPLVNYEIDGKTYQVDHLQARNIEKARKKNNGELSASMQSIIRQRAAKSPVVASSAPQGMQGMQGTKRKTTRKKKEEVDEDKGSSDDS